MADKEYHGPYGPTRETRQQRHTRAQQQRIIQQQEQLQRDRQIDAEKKQLLGMEGRQSQGNLTAMNSINANLGRQSQDNLANLPTSLHTSDSAMQDAALGVFSDAERTGGANVGESGLGHGPLSGRDEDDESPRFEMINLLPLKGGMIKNFAVYNDAGNAR